MCEHFCHLFAENRSISFEYEYIIIIIAVGGVRPSLGLRLHAPTQSRLSFSMYMLWLRKQTEINSHLITEQQLSGTVDQHWANDKRRATEP